MIQFSVSSFEMSAERRADFDVTNLKQGKALQLSHFFEERAIVFDIHFRLIGMGGCYMSFFS